MRFSPFATVLALLSVAACSTTSSGGDAGAASGCNTNPWSCPSSQTCWPSSTSSFSCLNAGSGAAGASCMNVVGQPSCGAGLACLTDSSGNNGTCVAYCDNTDPSHACSGGSSCQLYTLGQGGPQFSVCVPEAADGGVDATADVEVDSAPGADAGAGDSATAGDTSTTTEAGGGDASGD